MTAPRSGFFDRSGKLAVENTGVTPDIDVENFPKDLIAGRDPQLERAVAEALRLLKEIRATGCQSSRRRLPGGNGSRN